VRDRNQQFAWEKNMRDEALNHEAANNDASNIADPTGDATALGPGAPEILFTMLRRADKKPQSKTLTLENGELKKEPVELMSSGIFLTQTVSNLDEFIAVILDRTVFGPQWMNIYGVRPDREEANGVIATKNAIKKLKKAGKKAIARTKENFPWRRGPSIMLIDIDAFEGADLTPKLIDHVFCKVIPWWAKVKRFYVPSASSNIFSNGKLVSKKNGYHIYIIVDDGAKIPAIGNEIFIRLVEAGYGYHWTATDGKLQVRTWIDLKVYSPNHPDFAFGGHIPEGQDLEQRRDVVWFGSAPMLVPAGLGRNNFKEWYRDSEIVKKILNSRQAREDSDRNYKKHREEHVPIAEKLALAAGRDPSRVAGAYDLARQMRADGVYPLHEDFVLYGTVNGKYGPFTVADVFADLKKYDGIAIDDPSEPGKGDNKTRLYTLGQRSAPAINTFAHGGAKYVLVRDSEATKESLAVLDGLERPSWLGDDGDFDNEDLKARREAAGEAAEGATGEEASNSTSQNTASGGNQGTQTAGDGSQDSENAQTGDAERGDMCRSTISSSPSATVRPCRSTTRAAFPNSTLQTTR
jgi:hypothetical protein